MDEHNVHQYWGSSPAVDLLELLPPVEELKNQPPTDPSQPLHILQVGSYDCRHTLYTICRSDRHLKRTSGPVNLYVFEEEPELLARHLLLLSVLLDGRLPARERMETFLELHGNALLREKTAQYLDERGRYLEKLLVGLSTGGSSATAAVGSDPLAHMLDISLLKFQDRDAMVDAFTRYRTTYQYDMIKAWDTRVRRWHAELYDTRRNMIDWDYHMRMAERGTPGQDPAHGSIVHFHHFRFWRLHGIAFELRDSSYSQANKSMISTAVGRTKEFKDRSGKDVGRSVQALGFWGDILNSPYHCFGVTCEEPSFFKMTNKQFARTAVDVAEHNILAALHELRTGQPYVLGEGSEAHRAKSARGPTSLQDLQEEAGRQAQQEQAEGEGQSSQPEKEGQEAQQAQGGEGSASGQQQLQEQEQGQVQQAPPSSSSRAQQPAAPAADATAALQSSLAHSSLDDVDDDLPSSSTTSATAQLQAPQKQCQPDEAGAGAPPQPGTPSSPSSSAEPLPTATAPAPTPEPSSVTNTTVPSAAAAAAAAASGAGNPGPASLPPFPSTPTDADAVQQAMTREAEALQAQEAALDAQAHARCSRFRLVLCSGALGKDLAGKAKMAGRFDVVSLGSRHVHLLAPEHKLQQAAAPHAVLVVENARNILQLTKEQAGMFNDKVREVAQPSGWVEARWKTMPKGLTDAHMLFTR